jgi:hypothetical protein
MIIKKGGDETGKSLFNSKGTSTHATMLPGLPRGLKPIVKKSQKNEKCSHNIL